MAIFKSSNQRREGNGEDRARRSPGPERERASEVSAPLAQRAPLPGGGREGGGGDSVIGRTVSIHGEVVARCNLTIEGRIEGEVRAEGHELNIGEAAEVRASLRAKQVIVRGRVQGDITANEKIEIAPSGTVIGDICAPRVTLSDGSSFTGSINRETAPAVMERSGSREETRGASQAAADEEHAHAAAADRRGKDRPWSRPGEEPSQPSSPSSV